MGPDPAVEAALNLYSKRYKTLLNQQCPLKFENEADKPNCVSLYSSVLRSCAIIGYMQCLSASSSVLQSSFPMEHELCRVGKHMWSVPSGSHHSYGRVVYYKYALV